MRNLGLKATIQYRIAVGDRKFPAGSQFPDGGTRGTTFRHEAMAANRARATDCDVEQFRRGLSRAQIGALPANLEHQLSARWCICGARARWISAPTNGWNRRTGGVSDSVMNSYGSWTGTRAGSLPTPGSVPRRGRGPISGEMGRSKSQGMRSVATQSAKLNQ